MSNRNPKEICGNYIHYEKSPSECRKYAPRDMGGKPWAHVNTNDWCSEFEERKQKMTEADAKAMKRTMTKAIHG